MSDIQELAREALAEKLYNIDHPTASFGQQSRAILKPYRTTAEKVLSLSVDADSPLPGADRLVIALDLGDFDELAGIAQEETPASEGNDTGVSEDSSGLNDEPGDEADD